MSTTTRPIGKSHIPQVPRSLTFLRILQLLLGVTLLGLSAYGINVYSTTGFDLTLFTSIITIITIVYILFTEKRLAVGYNYWAILALDLFLIIFWLVSFAKSAAESADLDDVINFFDIPSYRYDGTYRNVLIVCAVFGAVQFLLFIITLFATAYFVHGHRREGGHSQPTATPVADLEMDRQMEPHTPAAAYRRTPPVPPTSVNAV